MTKWPHVAAVDGLRTAGRRAFQARALFMPAAGHGPTAADGAAADGTAHAGPAAHGGTAGTLGLASRAAPVLTAYVAWHALRCPDRCRRAEPADAEPTADAEATTGTVALRAPTWSFTAPQLAAAAHVVMVVVTAGMR